MEYNGVGQIKKLARRRDGLGDNDVGQIQKLVRRRGGAERKGDGLILPVFPSFLRASAPPRAIKKPHIIIPHAVILEP